MTSAADIMAKLGGHRTGRTFMVRCPCHADRSASLAVRDSEGGVLVYCHAGCPNTVVIPELKRLGLWPQHEHNYRPGTARAPIDRAADDAARIAYARDIWNAAVDPRGTLAERYLNARGLALDGALAMRCLRFHARCPFGKDDHGNRLSVPALIAAFRPVRGDNEDDPPRAIHRIGLTRDGRKIDKKMLGPVGGCAIKLDPDDSIARGLGITEGIESGIAVRQWDGFRPVWALGNAGAIRLFEPVPGIDCLTIFADHDPRRPNHAGELVSPGIDGARICGAHWSRAGHEVIVTKRPVEGLDAADA